MATTSHDRHLAALVVQLHSTSVCTIGKGWRLAFGPFETLTVHHVLAGSGVVRFGNSAPLPYGPGSIIIAPPRQGHIVGDAWPEAREVAAEDHCGPFADGLVAFTVGRDPGTLLLCGTIPAPHGGALSLLDLVTEAVVEVPDDEVGRGVFDLMRAEVAVPGLGTVAVTEALMKASLVALLRGRLRHGGRDLPSGPMPGDPRLARATLAVLEEPGAPHTVASLADKAGMSRASFSDHFARALGSGPMEFVQSVRLRAAARLLETTDLPLKVIAVAVGYADPTSLSRAFRGAYAQNPTTYRSIKGQAWPGLVDTRPGGLRRLNEGFSQTGGTASQPLD